MKKTLAFFFTLVALAPCLAQSPTTKWQVATIMDVKASRYATEEDPPALRYYITIRVGDMEYVALYIPPALTVKDQIEYKVGSDKLVLIGTDTIKYNDLLGTMHELPIVVRRTLPAAIPETKSHAEARNQRPRP